MPKRRNQSRRSYSSRRRNYRSTPRRRIQSRRRCTERRNDTRSLSNRRKRSSRRRPRGRINSRSMSNRRKQSRRDRTPEGNSSRRCSESSTRLRYEMNQCGLSKSEPRMQRFGDNQDLTRGRWVFLSRYTKQMWRLECGCLLSGIQYSESCLLRLLIKSTGQPGPYDNHMN